eukprot:TRINITY_DN3887_c0_g1_i2.p1 TRINITY_DN3887_c0_g1~~TRINITY_DN3887_c0_g1_i2.p1  ORF type:complete len:415 (+),score=76.95 TRINITY_DN3887_c0_g1_i2:75-1319(+)
MADIAAGIGKRMASDDMKGSAKRRSFYTESDCNLSDLSALTKQEVDREGLKWMSDVHEKVVIYECASLEEAFAKDEERKDIMSEWAHVLLDGPGVIVLKGAFKDASVLDDGTSVFTGIIADERAQKKAGGDHFAKAGANARIWNSLEKTCVRDPEHFADYWANHWIAGVSEAWLGPMYQITAQVNTILPGGKAQDMHRDYHLGFQSMETVAKFPLHCQVNVSPLLTLQGLVAHVDVPLDAGPTKLLPFSHKYAQGYLAWKREDFKQFFDENYVQLPLNKGDVLIFNPALYHAGGENRTSGSTSVIRTVNLFQVSSPFGRSMESVNRLRMCQSLYPVLLKRRQAASKTFDERAEDCAIWACAEGYQFPSNLDLDVPDGNVAPLSQAELFKKSLEENVQPDAFFEKLMAQAKKKAS